MGDKPNTKTATSPCRSFPSRPTSLSKVEGAASSNIADVVADARSTAAAAVLLDFPISAPAPGAETRNGSIKEGSERHVRASSWAQPKTIDRLLLLGGRLKKNVKITNSNT